MADSILKLRVESSEYDQKIKRAAEGIQDLAKRIHDSQGEFAGLEKEQKDFIESLQYMTTVSKTTTGQARELETAYKQLQALYNSFNGFEKNSEEGKLLAEQLSILKQRTLDAKSAVSEADNSLKEQGGILDSLTSKFTFNIDALKLFDTAMSAVKSALDVAKDAFFASESNVDEWGRTVEASKSVYEGFLTAINTGDISGYLGRINEIVLAARQAYDELDRLGTMKTIQGPRVSAQQTENERLRMMIQTGRYIAPVDGRRASMQNGQVLTPGQIRRLEQQLQNGLKNVVTLVGNEVQQTGKAIDAVYNRQAKELGMSLKEFRKGTSSMAEFDKRIEGYRKYQEWRSAHTTIDLQSGREIVARNNPYQQYAKWGTFRVDGQRYNDLVQLIQQRDQQASQTYGMQSQAYRTMNRAEGLTLRQIMKGGGGSGGTGGGKTTVAEAEKELTIQQQIAALEKEALDANLAEQIVIAKKVQELEKQLEKQKAIRNMLHFNTDDKQASFLNFDSFNKKAIKDFTDKSKSKDQKETKGIVNTLKEGNALYSQAVGGISGIASGIQQLGIELPEGLQSILGVLMGISTIVGSIEALVTVGTAVGIFANGGIVPHAANGYFVGGNRFSGDTTPILANAGELVLSRSQQNILAHELSNNNNNIAGGQPYVSGELVYLAINNYLRRSGRGEILLAKR